MQKNKEIVNEIINREKKEIIPLTDEKNNIYNKQEIFYIQKEKFCLDKDDKNYINRKKVKIIVIILENLEDLPIVFAI